MNRVPLSTDPTKKTLYRQYYDYTLTVTEYVDFKELAPFEGLEEAERSLIYELSCFARMEIYNFFPRYVQNNFPIRLIDVKTMRLLASWEVLSYLKQVPHTIVKENLEALVNSDNTENLLRDLLQNYQWYSILSHRWDSNEVLFKDILQFPNITLSGVAKLRRLFESDKTYFDNRSILRELLKESASEVEEISQSNGTKKPIIHSIFDLVHAIGPVPTAINAGFVKLINFCYFSLTQYSINLAWIDTCCIDKSSSAELEESIRSMFRWYRNAGICLTYLGKTADLEGGVGILRQDPWFSRGWTLQELLAPKQVKFYGSKWNPLAGPIQVNDKVAPPENQKIEDRRTILEMVSEITQISLQELLNFEPGLNNIRGRLAWASGRETTRVEDEAYCLLGIFNVTISIAYGEGENAFQRLQEAILQRSNDRSLFLWEYDFFARNPQSYQSSILAARPKEFWSANEGFTIVSDTNGVPDTEDLPPAHFTLTNHGLQIAISFCDDDFARQWMKEMEIDDDTKLKYKLAILAYAQRDDSKTLYPTFLLLTEHKERGYIHYKRHNSERTFRRPRTTPYISTPMPTPARPRLIYIR